MRRPDQIRTRDERRAACVCIHCGREPALLGREAGESCTKKQADRDLRRRIARRAAGICITCGRAPVAEGHVRCAGCHATYQPAGKVNVTNRERAAFGVCRDCGDQLPEDTPSGLIRCPGCREKGVVKQTQRREARLAAGLCGTCGKTAPVEGTTRCAGCETKSHPKKPARAAPAPNPCGAGAPS